MKKGMIQGGIFGLGIVHDVYQGGKTGYFDEKQSLRCTYEMSSWRFEARLVQMRDRVARLHLAIS